ncbi:T9SS type A sorting domain-containing protein [candidate division WOR-3 bacterium]|nr:T9SS type A sorting domain-containing protein [candidate division WOR-3 bacterium]
MRYAVCIGLLVPILALAAGPARFTIGSVDTVGGTTYDWQFSGPCWRMLVNPAGHGMYVVWMYSTSMSGSTFPDRNMRLNYYDRTLQKWVYIDSSDFMTSGVSVFPKRAGYGSVDADTSGTPYISCHATFGTTRPWIEKGLVGDYSDTTLPSCMWPAIAVGRNGAVHILPMTGSYDLTYCRIAPDSWPHWSAPMTGITPSPGFPSHSIAASKVSNRVSLVWEINQTREAYQMHSTDGGITWGSPAALAPPDAYGGDTATGFHLSSLSPFYDRHDRFHIVANLCPVVDDTALVVPSQIWHYCPDNPPAWSRIHVAGCNPAHMTGSVGSNATYACRPTIGEDQAGGLYVVWEQFDSLNVDSTTSRLRADIFLAQDNGDNGASWQPAVRITDQGTWSCRFPSAIDHFDDDTFRVAYMIDEQAGFFAGGFPEGAATRNPVVVHKVPVTVGIAEGKAPLASNGALRAEPNPFGGTTAISYLLGRAGSAALTVHDATGKAVRRLAGGPQPAGFHSVSWDGRDDRGRALPTGVYFCTLESGGRSTSRKLVLTE